MHKVYLKLSLFLFEVTKQIIRMKYQTDNKYRKSVQGYIFLSFAGNFGNKHGKKLISSAKKFSKSKYGKALKKEGVKFAKISGKQILEKSAQATGDLIGNRITDRITSLGNKPEEQQEEQQE